MLLFMLYCHHFVLKAETHNRVLFSVDIRTTQRCVRTVMCPLCDDPQQIRPLYFVLLSFFFYDLMEESAKWSMEKKASLWCREKQQEEKKVRKR